MTAPKAPKELKLSDPLEWEGKEITRLRIAKPKVKDLKRLNAALENVEDKLEQGIVMAAILTGLPNEAIEELDTDDFTALSEAIADFFPQGLGSEGGDPSSPKQPTG